MTRMPDSLRRVSNKGFVEEFNAQPEFPQEHPLIGVRVCITPQREGVTVAELIIPINSPDPNRLKLPVFDSKSALIGYVEDPLGSRKGLLVPLSSLDSIQKSSIINSYPMSLSKAVRQEVVANTKSRSFEGRRTAVKTLFEENRKRNPHLKKGERKGWYTRPKKQSPHTDLTDVVLWD